MRWQVFMRWNCALLAITLTALHNPCYGAGEALAEPTMALESGQATYNGQQITLSEGVVIDHEIGDITAEKVVLTISPDEKKTRFSFLHMEDDVKILLKDGSRLTCAAADLDYQMLTGVFMSDHQQDFVIFNEYCPGKNGTSIPLTVKSRELGVKLIRSTGDAHKAPASLIGAIAVDRNVTINYNNDFIAAADHGTYSRINNSTIDPLATGVINLTMADADGVCQVTNRNGDLIRATRIAIDTAKRHLAFVVAAGALCAHRTNEKLDKIEFSAGTLEWDDWHDVMILSDNVTVDQKGIGTLKAEKEVRLYQHQVKGKRQLRTMEANGVSVLTHTDEATGLSHELTCHGKLVVNHENLETVLESPVDGDGAVPVGKQVFFHDHMGEIYADKAQLNYEIVGNEIVPSRLVLTGNVTIFDRYSASGDLAGTVLRYAIADKVEYLPKTKEITFSGKGKKRVLFFDKLNNIQISATALKMKRDPFTAKESVKGIGDVRFSFVEQEFEQLKNKFNLEFPSGNGGL